MSPKSPLRPPLALAAVLGLLAFFAGSPGPAGAVDAAKPSPCIETHITDPAADGEYDPSGTLPSEAGGGVGPAPDNLEILSVFLNYRADKDGKKVLTANIELKNMSMAVPAGLGASGGLWYYAHFVYADVAQFVRAAIKSNGTVTYAYGSVDDTGVYTTEGTTTGAIFEGPNGIVQLDVPEAIGGKPGEKLGGLMAAADTIEGQDDFFGFNHHADLAPDETDVTAPDGKDYTVVECPASGGGGTPPPSGGGTPPPSGGGTPPPSGGGTPPPSGGGAPPAGATKLNFSAPSTLGSAKKAKKKRKLIFKVKAGADITNLKIALKPKKGPAVGTATIKLLKKGSSKVTLKVSKKLKAGKYILAAQGTQGGQTLGVSKNVKVKK